VSAESVKITPKSIFVVHGHDGATNEKVSRFIEKLDL
jgi:hypothetical protein